MVFQLSAAEDDALTVNGATIPCNCGMHRCRIHCAVLIFIPEEWPSSGAALGALSLGQHAHTLSLSLSIPFLHAAASAWTHVQLHGLHAHPCLQNKHMAHQSMGLQRPVDEPEGASSQGWFPWASKMEVRPK